jgi:hypothetical protein
MHVCRSDAYFEIQKLKTKINTHLDKLQEDLMRELTEAEKQVTTETHELHVSLDEKQRKLISLPLVFIFCFRLSCIFSTDMGGDSSATIIRI